MSSTLRILQVANGFPPTALAGTESHTYALARQLAGSHSVHVFCREADPARPEYTVIQDSVDGLPVTRVVNNYLDATDFELLYRNHRIEHIFGETLERFQPDLVHLQHCVGLSAGCIDHVLARRLPFVLTLHDYWYICPTVNLLRPDMALCLGTHHLPNCFDCVRLLPTGMQDVTQLPGYTIWRQIIPLDVRVRILKLLSRFRANREGSGSPPVRQRADYMRALLASSPALIVPSEYVKRQYIEFGISPELFHIIPLGMDAQRWLNAPQRKRTDGLVRLGYVGGLLPHKGGEVIVRAFMQAQGVAELAMYGLEPPGETFVSYLKRLAAPDSRIRFMGPIPNDQLPEVFGRMDALLMPALWHETFSFLTREAILAGLPVIASNMGVLPELIQEGVNGRLLPAGDVDAWAACLRDLIERPQQLDTLRPRRESLRVWSQAENAQANLAVYYAVLNRVKLADRA